MAKTTAHTHNESRKTGNSSETTSDPNKTQPKLIKNRKHDAAILFVHGIGNQKAGDVLEKWQFRLRTKSGEFQKNTAGKLNKHKKLDFPLSFSHSADRNVL